jgi:hypothetical protein
LINFAELEEALLELGDAGVVGAGGGFVEFDEEGGANLRTAVDAAVAAAGDGFGEEMLGADEEGPIGADFGEGESLGEIVEVAGAVLEADDFFEVRNAAEGFQLEMNFGHHRHVVEEEREGQLRDEALDVFEEFGLAGGEIVGGGGDDAVGAGIGGELGEVNGLDEGGIGDADKNGEAIVNKLARAGDEFAAEAVAEAGGFAAGAEDEDGADAAVDELLDEAFEAGDVEEVTVEEGCDHRGDDAAKLGAGEGRSFGGGGRAAFGR